MDLWIKARITATQREACKALNQFFNLRMFFYQGFVLCYCSSSACQVLWSAAFVIVSLFCVISAVRELPGSPLWPCANSSLHDTSEQRGHLTLTAPPLSLPPFIPTLPPSLQEPLTVSSRTMRSLVPHLRLRTHTHTHTHNLILLSRLGVSPPPPAHQRQCQAHSLLHCICTVKTLWRSVQ